MNCKPSKIGERIRFFRRLRNMTQKSLGTAVGFPEKTADVRLAQYEAGKRTPKAALTAALAQVLNVSPQALTIPDIDSPVGLMHTFFALEDTYGIIVCETSGDVCLRINREKSKASDQLFQMLLAWQKQAKKYLNGEISKEEYDRWRYSYPNYDTI